MKAMVCEAFGGPEVLALRDLPDPPPPGPGEIQVRIRARGVQYVDVLMLAGKYQVRPDPPFIPGGEAAGEVVAVGPDVTTFKPGRPRHASRHTLGACAELGNAKAALCDLVPDGMDLESAGVFRGAYSTAYHALLQRGRLKEVEFVLVHGAAGGIGIAAIQVAKLFGAKVIATASGEAKRQRVPGRRRGSRDRIRRRLCRQGQGADRRAWRRHRLRPDRANARVYFQSLRCLAWCGRLLILGFLGGGPTNIRSNYLLIKGIDAIGVRIGGLNEANPALAIANMRELTKLAAAGKLKPRISHRFRLDQAAEALHAVIDRAVIGKAVLVS